MGWVEFGVDGTHHPFLGPDIRYTSFLPSSSSPVSIASSMARKRQKPHISEHNSSSLAKRPRFEPEPPNNNDEPNPPTRQNPSMVLVNGLSDGCSVLNLKSRLEIYGCISRIRIEHGVGHVNFRSKDSAEAAIAAASNPSLGITIDTQKVHVSWPNDPLPQWREGVRLSVKERLSSKLLRPEVPLSRHGRGNKLGLDNLSPKNGFKSSLKPRDVVAYDDLF